MNLEAVGEDSPQNDISIYLVVTNDIRWFAVRALLAQLPDVRVVGEAEHADQAITSVRIARPTVVFIDTEIPSRQIAQVARRLHEVSPVSKLVIVGDVVEYDPLVALGRVPIESRLLWRDVTDFVRHHGLDVLVKACLRVGSPEVADEIVAPVERRRSSLARQVTLTEQERVVLTALVNGATEAEIAEQEHMSPAVVDRVVQTLKDKLNAHTLCQMGVRAMELGIELRRRETYIRRYRDGFPSGL